MLKLTSVHCIAFLDSLHILQYLKGGMYMKS